MEDRTFLAPQDIPTIKTLTISLFCVFSYEIEKFARNTGLKLFRTSVKENLNVSKVFHYLGERHVEAVSRWVDGRLY